MAAMARWCFQRRAWVLIGWLALLAVLGVTGRAAGSAYSDSLTLPGTGSTTAQNLLEQAFPGHAGDQETIVWRASSGSVSAPAVRDRITAMLAKVARRARGGLGDQPVLRPRRRPGQPERADRLRERGLRRPASQPARAGRHPRRPPRRGRAGPRRPGRHRRPRGGERAAALGRHQRRRRRHSRGDRAVHRVRVAAGHAAAPGHRDRRAGLGPDDDRAPLARGDHSLGRPDAGHLDRARRGHRLRAVHRHPAPQQPQSRDVPGRGRGPRAEHLRPRGPVRRDHRVHRPARDARAAHRLHLRPGHRRRDHRAVHRGRRRHLAARAARLPRDAGPVPPGTPPAGRRRARARRHIRGVGAAGRVRAAPPRPAGRRRRHRHARAGHPGALTAAGLLRRRQRPGRHHHPPGLRPARRRLRPRLQRPPGTGRHHQHPRGCGRVRPAGRHAADRARDRRGLRARPRPRRLADQRDPHHLPRGHGHQHPASASCATA